MATHYPEAILLPDHTALSTVFSRFGFPTEILSDKGQNFMSELMQIFLNEFKVKQIRSSNDQRFDCTISPNLKINDEVTINNWDEYLPWILFAYREIPVEILGFSPFETLFGRAVRGPLGLLKSAWKPTSPENAKSNVIEFMLDLHKKLRTCHDLACGHAQQAKTKSKVWYDKKARDRTNIRGWSTCSRVSSNKR